MDVLWETCDRCSLVARCLMFNQKSLVRFLASEWIFLTKIWCGPMVRRLGRRCSAEKGSIPFISIQKIFYFHYWHSLVKLMMTSTKSSFGIMFNIFLHFWVIFIISGCLPSIHPIDIDKFQCLYPWVLLRTHNHFWVHPMHI